MEIPYTALDLLSNSYTESRTHLPHVSHLRESLFDDITSLEAAFYCPLKKYDDVFKGREIPSEKTCVGRCYK